MLAKIWPILLVAIGLADIAFDETKVAGTECCLPDWELCGGSSLRLAIAFPTGVNTRQVEISQTADGVTPHHRWRLR